MAATAGAEPPARTRTDGLVVETPVEGRAHDREGGVVVHELRVDG